ASQTRHYRRGSLVLPSDCRVIDKPQSDACVPVPNCRQTALNSAPKPRHRRLGSKVATPPALCRGQRFWLSLPRLHVRISCLSELKCAPPPEMATPAHSKHRKQSRMRRSQRKRKSSSLFLSFFPRQPLRFDNFRLSNRVEFHGEKRRRIQFC